MNVIRRTLLSASSAVALGALVAGCSAASSSSASGTDSPAADASAASAGSALLGPQLGKALLPLNALPAGFKDNPSGDRNSGQQKPSDSPQAVPASKVCDTLGGIGWIQDGGVQTNVFAETDHVNADQTAEIGEEADTFTGDDASKVMAALWQVFGKCAKFTEHSDSNNAPITITSKKLPGIGDGAIEAVELSPVYQGGTTIAAVRVGDVIVTTIDSSPKSDNGSAALTYAEKIADSVRRAQQA